MEGRREGEQMRASDNDTCLREKKERESKSERENARAQERLPYIQIKSHFGYGEEDSKNARFMEL